MRQNGDSECAVNTDGIGNFVGDAAIDAIVAVWFNK